MMDFDFALDTHIYFSGSDCNSEHKISIGSENVDFAVRVGALVSVGSAVSVLHVRHRRLLLQLPPFMTDCQ